MTRPLQSLRLIVCVGLFWAGLGASCQEAPAANPPSTDKYAAEPAVVEKSEAVYRMAADGTGTELFTRVTRVQSESALREVSVVSVGYAANSEKAEFLYVRVRHPDGSVVDSPVSEAIEVPQAVTQQAPFYSDLKMKQVPVRSLKVGDTLEWQARLTITRAEAMNQFWGQESFNSEAVALSEVVELRAPKDKAVIVWSPQHKPVETVDGDERVWRWENAQLKPTTGPDAEARKEAEKKKLWTPEQELDAKEGKLPDIAWTTFKSWEEVGAWYRGLEGDRTNPNAEVKAKVAELVAGKTTEEEKIRAVYGYVATQVRYVGVAFGVGRYQPHEAGDVLENQYGDCKDKHTLLAAMLSAIGLHPDAVLIGAGIRFNEAVPSPAAFNHLITRVMVDGKPVWLDTTSEVAPYQMLLAQIRDHRALIVPEAGTAKVDTTPAALPFKAVQTLDSTGAIDADGTATSRIVLTERGDDEVYLRAALRQIAPSQYDALAQQLSESMGYGGKASHAELSRAEDTATPFKISYDYKRTRSTEWDTRQIVPEVAPVGLPRVDDKDPPVQSIALGSVRLETSKSAQKIPDGWSAELPEAIHAKSPWATVDQTYRFEKGVLYSERNVEVLQEKVPATEWKAYKKFSDSAMLGQEQYVQLVHFEVGGADSVKAASGKAEAGAGIAGPSKKASNPAAAKLIQDAINSLQQMDITAARKQLDDAKALNEEQSKLWMTYGNLDFALGAPTAAIADFEKEVQLHPGSSSVYGFLATLQRERGLDKEAEATLHKWEMLDERNPAPAKALAQLLMYDGDAPAAAAAAKTALGLTPEGEDKDEQLQYILGNAQLKSGLKEEGRQTLADLLARTDDSKMINKAAYALGDAGLELPLAEKSTRTALDRMEEESRSWTLDEQPKTLIAKTGAIAATWDTLGWILFHEGRLEESEAYVRAAWLNLQSPEGSEHLAEIALAKGDKNAALAHYEFAMAAHGGPLIILALQHKGINIPGNASEQQAAFNKALQPKADALRKAGAKSSEINSQKVRTIALGPARGLDGTAEYRLLLSADKVERVEATGEKTLAGGDARLMQADMKGWVPAGSKAEVVKVVLLNCHSSICEVVVEP